MLAELTDILGRQKFARKIAASQLSIDQLVDGYAQLVSVVRPAATPRIAPDPDDDDDVVIGTALAAKAELVVTGDKPLLCVREHQGVRILDVRQVVRGLEATGKPDTSAPSLEFFTLGPGEVERAQVRSDRRTNEPD